MKDNKEKTFDEILEIKINNMVKDKEKAKEIANRFKEQADKVEKIVKDTFKFYLSKIKEFEINPGLWMFGAKMLEDLVKKLCEETTKEMIFMKNAKQNK